MQRDNNYPSLIRDIVVAAKGVFLRDFLAVRSLLEGLANAGKIVDLQKRHRLLPAAPNKYFEQYYLPRRSFITIDGSCFMLPMEACKAVPLMAYWFVD